MKTNIKLIEHLIHSGNLRSYAVWLLLRHNYKNGVFYKYNCNKMHCVTGASRHTVRKYIKEFLRLGWCRMHKGNLSFIGRIPMLSLHGINYGSFIIVKGESVKELLANLRYEVYRNKQKNFTFLKEITKELINPCGENAAKVHRKAVRFFRKRGDAPTQLATEDLKISLSKLGKLIGRSASTAHALIKQKVTEGLATVMKGEINRVKGINVPLPEGMFYCKGYIFTPSCNKYVFS